MSFDIWPENWPVVDLFTKLQTQWRMGAAGPTGLDYNVLYTKLDRMGLTPDEADEWESDIRTMEYAAIAVLNEKKG